MSWSAEPSLSGSCSRRPGGKHAAPCHPWHAASVEAVSVPAVLLMVTGSPFVAPSPPHYQGQHAAADVTLPLGQLVGV